MIYLETLLVASEIYENLQNIHDASRYTLTLWRHRDHSRKPSDVILKDLAWFSSVAFSSQMAGWPSVASTIGCRLRVRVRVRVRVGIRG